MPSRHKDKAWTLAYGIFNGARFAAFYGAVLFMPMADYIVCIATTPIFSYIFSILLIKSKFTILKVYIILELRIIVAQENYVGEKSNVHNTMFVYFLDILMRFCDSGYCPCDATTIFIWIWKQHIKPNKEWFTSQFDKCKMVEHFNLVNVLFILKFVYKIPMLEYLTNFLFILTIRLVWL